MGAKSQIMSNILITHSKFSQKSPTTSFQCIDPPTRSLCWVSFAISASALMLEEPSSKKYIQKYAKIFFVNIPNRQI